MQHLVTVNEDSNITVEGEIHQVCVCVCVCVRGRRKRAKKIKMTGTRNTGMFRGLANDIAATTTAVLHAYNVIMFTLDQRKVEVKVKHTKCTHKTIVLLSFTQKPVILW